MKKLLLIACLVFTFAGAGAQGVVPNAGFENWTLTGGHFEPDLWKTLNLYSDSSAQKSFILHNGAFAILLLTDSGNAPLYNNITFPGVAATSPATVTYTTQVNITGGLAFANRPDSITGYTQYKHPGGVDTASIMVLLTHWNNTSTPQKRDTVGICNHYFTATTPAWGLTSSYQFFGDTIRYLSTILPDTCFVLMMSSQLAAPVDGSSFLVDDLAFKGIDSTQAPVSGVGIRELGEKNSLILYPNPATHSLNISFGGKTGSTLVIHNMLGQLVSQIKITNPVMNVDVAELKDGLYIYRILSEDGEQTDPGRFVIGK